MTETQSKIRTVEMKLDGRTQRTAYYVNMAKGFALQMDLNKGQNPPSTIEVSWITDTSTDES